MAMSFLDQFKAARRVSTPLIAVRTPDIGATISTIATDKLHMGTPIILWDAVRGLVGVNGEPPPKPASHGRLLAQMLVTAEDPETKDPKSLAHPVNMLLRAMEMPKDAILFMANLHRFLHDPQVVQAVWNLRDAFKQNTRTLVIPCPSITLPPELSQDVLVLDEPLPDAAQLAGIVGETYAAAQVKAPDNETVTRAVDALCGLAAFSAEQVCAMSIRKEGMDLSQLWERKRQQIEQTPGLSVYRGAEVFKDIGGCENAKTFLTQVINGELKPRAIVFQDEIEKAFGGAAGDLSGTTQELLGYQLTFMQDHNSTGVLSLGPAGVAKTAIAKALGNEAGIPTIQFDLGAMKGSLVGESNANMRMALKVVEAVSQGRALWIATCNDIRALPPELRRRYSFGTFFYDLPTPGERSLIWKIYFEKFGLTEKIAGPKPADHGWTGAEIKNCCDMAFRLKIPLLEAAGYIVPISVSASERITNLRHEADGRFISASVPGPYRAPEGMEPPSNEGDMVVAVGVVKGKRKIDTPPETGGGKGKVN